MHTALSLTVDHDGVPTPLETLSNFCSVEIIIQRWNKRLSSSYFALDLRFPCLRCCLVLFGLFSSFYSSRGPFRPPQVDVQPHTFPSSLTALGFVNHRCSRARLVWGWQQTRDHRHRIAGVGMFRAHTSSAQPLTCESQFSQAENCQRPVNRVPLTRGRLERGSVH